MAPTSGTNPSDNLSLAMEPINPNKRLKVISFSSSAEEVMGNKDLLIEILVRLPARSIVRFKSVSKQWRYLILGTYSPPKHVNFIPKRSISGLYYISDTFPIPLQGHPLPTLTFTGKPKSQQGFKIHDSRHGLMLCSYFTSTYMLQIIICNPTTQKSKVFHQRALNLDMEIPCFHFYLHFDPSVSLVYKLIWIRSKESHYEVSICASNRSIWKTISLEAQQQWGYLLIHGVLSSDGVIYMMTEKWYLVQFDVETEKLSAALTTQEPEMGLYRNIGYFGERAGGNLVLIVSPESGLDFMIYEMDKLESRKWVLKYRIDFTKELRNLPVLQRPIIRSHFAIMRAFWDGENKERDLTLVIGVPGKVISYDHNRKITRVICNLPGCDFFDWDTTYCYVQPFVGSLCSI